MNKQFTSTDKLVILYAILIAIAFSLFISKAVSAKAESTMGWNHDVVQVDNECSNRVHFAYHNDDPYSCTTPDQPKQDKQDKPNQPTTTTVDNTPDQPVIVPPTSTPDVPSTSTPDVPVVTTPDQPTTPETPDQPDQPTTEDKSKDNCNNGAGNGDNCTPGHSSGSNQGKGQQTGDQTNQGENGQGKDKKS